MKKIIAILLALFICLSLTACGEIKQEEVPGTWSGSWEAGGVACSETLTLNADGTYTGSYVMDEIETPLEGTWWLEKGILCVQEAGQVIFTEFSFKGGKLYNGEVVVLTKTK